MLVLLSLSFSCICCTGAVLASADAVTTVTALLLPSAERSLTADKVGTVDQPHNTSTPMSSAVLAASDTRPDFTDLSRQLANLRNHFTYKTYMLYLH